MGLKTITEILNASPPKAAGSASQFPCWFLPHVLSLLPLGGLMSKHFSICSLEEVSAGTLDPNESLNYYCIMMRWDVGFFCRYCKKIIKQWKSCKDGPQTQVNATLRTVKKFLKSPPINVIFYCASDFDGAEQKWMWRTKEATSSLTNDTFLLPTGGAVETQMEALQNYIIIITEALFPNLFKL